MNNSKNDKTSIMMLPEIKIKVYLVGASPIEYKFQNTFQIGRDEKCEVSINEKIVSRSHLKVYYDANRWWVEDLHSMNGTYLDGKKIDRIPINLNLRLELGKNGPQVLFEVTNETSSKTKTEQFKQTEAQDFEYHLLAEKEQNIGTRTRYMRLILKKAQEQQKKKYINYILMITILFLVATCFAIYKHREVKQQKLLAEQIFYEMKELEVRLANLSENENFKKNKELNTIFTEFKSKHHAQEKNYNQLIDNMAIYSSNKEPVESLILKIARIFGECELNVPPDFMKEVKKYISYWQKTPQFRNSIEFAQNQNYVSKIMEAMEAQELVPHYFYVALKESGFDPKKCGIPTPSGIAKGTWQFIPRTASHYGLNVGELANYAIYDRDDERHNFEKSTYAAARCIKDLYATDAQASGLLVIACYNWGAGWVLDLVRQLPANPRERNFWNLLLQFRDKIPRETYDYVFYIFSAAVIGENPRLFGFDFDNPLACYEGS